MTVNTFTFTTGSSPNTVRSANDEFLTMPSGWIPLPPDDVALTRRVEASVDQDRKDSQWVAWEMTCNKQATSRPTPPHLPALPGELIL